MTANWAGDPATWVSGELSSSMLNTEVRDRMEWLREALALHGITSADALGPLFGSGYGVSLWKNPADNTINPGTEAGVQWSEAGDWDDGPFWSVSVPQRITIPAGAGGRYRFDLQFTWSANGVGSRSSWLEVNLSDQTQRIRLPSAGSGNVTGYDMSRTLLLTPGDFVIARVFHNADVPIQVEVRAQVELVARA